MITISTFKTLVKYSFLILLSLIPEIGWTTEICDNGIDDDNNGLIDLNDPGCDCTVVSYQSMIPNPSFEAYNCCPWTAAQMDCVDDWSQASAATTDYMNECDWIDETFFTPPLPFPDGDGALRLINGHTFFSGNTTKLPYKEYAGVCLNYPMKKDSLYLFELYVGFIEKSFSPDFNLSFFGTTDCANLPFSTGIEFDCPTSYTGWRLLKSTLIDNDFGNNWQKVSIQIMPDQDIAALAIGPDCVLVESSRSLYYFLDDFILNKKSAFDFQLLPLKSPCSPDFTFAVKNNINFTYQWYKEGIALVGETAAELSAMQGEGRYQLRIINGTGCRISEDYIFTIPVYTDSISQVICEQETFLFGENSLTEPGIYVDTFTSVENCDSIVTLSLEVRESTTDSLSIHILKGSNFELNGRSYHAEGNYPILFTTTGGCDSLIMLQLSVSNIYIPTAFSPNADGNNDVFRIFGAAGEITDVVISIYDRWGNQLFVGKEWDGTASGKVLNAGVFVYRIEVTTVLGKKLQYTGDVTLMR